MAFTYKNLIIEDSLTVQSTGSIITTTKGDMITSDGVHTIRLPVGTDGQLIVADSASTNGLEWRSLSPADINLIAGNGLVLTNDTLSVGGSSTIIANVGVLNVNSSAISDQVLLSNGIVGTSAVYGSLPLNNSNSVSGILPIISGGTGVSAFSAASCLVSTDSTNSILTTTNLNPSTVVTLTGNQTLQNKTLIDPNISGAINDVNGNAIFNINSTQSAVNNITIGNALTNNAPNITASGNDTNISLNINAKGSGNVIISSLQFPNADGTANQVLATSGAGILSFVEVPIEAIATITTSDATTTVVNELTIPTIANTAYYVEAKFIARESDNNSQAAVFITKSIFLNSAGILILDGNEFMYAPNTISWTANLVISGTDITAQVTGAIGETVAWKIIITTVSI